MPVRFWSELLSGKNYMESEVCMGKLRPERPTLAQKKAISRAGLLPDNWMVLDDGSVSMVILSRKSGQRRVISK